MLKRREKEKLKNLKNKTFWVLLISFFMFCLIGCKEEKPKVIKIKIPKKALNKRVAKQRDNKMKFIGKKELFKYIAHSERDPFMPFFKFNQQTVAEEEEIPRTPLTSYSLNQLKLKAIMFGKNKKPIAMVETEDKLGLFFSVGDYIGTELYKVVAINNDTVLLQKKIKDFLNNVKIVEKELSIENEGE